MRVSVLRSVLLAAFAGWFSIVACARSSPVTDVVIKNATVMTASHGTIEHGSVWIHKGKIAGVASTVNAPASATVIDASGKYLTPGLIDPHSFQSQGRCKAI